MKLLFRLGAIVFAFACSALHAQLPTLVVNDARYSGTRIFDSNPGYTIGAMTSDGAGNVYYIESDGVNFTGNGTLFRRSSSDGYSTATPLFDLGPGGYGSFMLFAGGKVYFGDGFTIRTIDGSGTVDVLGTVVNNYDAVVVGTSLYVSNNPDTTFVNPQNRVTKFDLVAQSGGDGGLMLGTGDIIINTVSDYSGPIEYSGTDFYYGASGSSNVHGLYKFSTAEIASAFGPTELTLDDNHKFGLTTTNGAASLSFGYGRALWKDGFDSPNLLRFDRDTGDVDLAIASAQGTASLGALDFASEVLYVDVSDFSLGRVRSSIFTLVPEPSSALALLAGSFVFLRRRR
jgi:hypothetical protein